jgi:hypothetical protein
MDVGFEDAVGVVGDGCFELTGGRVTVKEGGRGKLTLSGRRKLSLFMDAIIIDENELIGKYQFYNLPILFKNLSVFEFSL